MFRGPSELPLPWCASQRHPGRWASLTQMDFIQCEFGFFFLSTLNCKYIVPPLSSGSELSRFLFLIYLLLVILKYKILGLKQDCYRFTLFICLEIRMKQVNNMDVSCGNWPGENVCALRLRLRSLLGSKLMSIVNYQKYLGGSGTSVLGTM